MHRVTTYNCYLAIMSESVTISDWCKNQTVFISGGSGFIGKAILYKLLLCGTPKIYVLLRPKKGQNPDDRLDDIFKQEIFESLTAKDANLRSKLVAVSGDVTEIDLALSNEDREVLQEHVTVVFHVAASVKFDDSLKKAVHNNLRATRDMVLLAKQMKNLKMFNYISTAYSNSDHMLDQGGVLEKIYERKMDWEKLIEFVDTAPEEVINGIEQKILGASPNTYIFTKHLAEAVIEDAARDIPVVITRPPIVGSGLKEPLPGWLDNVSSPVAIIGATGKGILRVYFGTSDALKAYISVDIVVNCIIAATWRGILSDKEPTNSEIAVYNMDYNPTTTGQLKKRCFKLLETHPTANALWHTHFYTINNRHLFLLAHLLIHFIPGLIFDAILTIAGQKPRLIRIYRKLYVALITLVPFTNTDDNFAIANYENLKKAIPESEKTLFDLYVPRDEKRVLDYLKLSATGFRKLIGDPPYPTEKDFIHQKRMAWIDRIFRVSFLLLILWVFPFYLLKVPFEYTFSLYLNIVNGF